MPSLVIILIKKIMGITKLNVLMAVGLEDIIPAVSISPLPTA